MMLRNLLKEIKWKEDRKGIIGIVLLLICILSAYGYLYYQQRQIDENLEKTTGKIVEHRIFVVQSGWAVRYLYNVNGKKYKGYSKTNKKLQIDFSKDYVVEYSSKDPSNSRIIINGEKYAHGVD